MCFSDFFLEIWIEFLIQIGGQMGVKICEKSILKSFEILMIFHGFYVAQGRARTGVNTPGGVACASLGSGGSRGIRL